MGREARRADDLVFRPIGGRNAFEETVERLVDAIKLGLVRHGEALPPERELAPRLGVSRVTLREAVRSLQHAGYVESRRGRTGGTFVIYRPRHTPSDRAARRVARQMGADAIVDALDFRAVLEPAAAALAAERFSDADEDRLGPLAEAAQRAASADYRAADSHLHLVIAEIAGVPSLLVAITEVQAHLTDLLTSIPRLERAVEHANEQHRRIVAAIEARDPVAAREAMEEHLAATANLIRGFLT